MRTIARYLIRLYPGAWRSRYGEEFAALLDDSTVTFSSFLDLMKEAIRMHLSIPSFPKLALLLSTIGLLGGLLVAHLIPNTYISETTLSIDGASGPFQVAQLVSDWEKPIFSRTSLSRIITDPRLDLYRSERARKPLEDVIETMRNRDIQIRMIPGTSSFTISFAYPDRVKAHDTAWTLAMHLVEEAYQRRHMEAHRGANQFARLEARVALLEKRLGVAPSDTPQAGEPVTVADGLTVRVLEPATVPVNPAKPNRPLIASLGFGIGFLAALIVAAFRRQVQPAIAA
jgi:hypothetical protein